MRLWTLVVFLGFVPAALQAQNTLSGQVLGEDGVPLSGVTVTVTGGDLIGSVTATTGEDGDYSLPDLSAGLYMVTAERDGYATGERSGIAVKTGLGGRADFVLAREYPADAIVVRAVTNAATNLPPMLTDGAIPRGGIVTVWGQNLGGEGLVVNETIPLPTMLGDVRAYVQTADGQRYELFPLYTTPVQSAYIVSSDTPAGEGTLIVERAGQMSNAFRVRVVDRQPGFFSVNQSGQGAGVVTRPDFSLITPEKPAKPGDVLILWGTGMGPNAVDNEPAVFDKRQSLLQWNFLPEELQLRFDVFYIGSSGTPGVDQANTRRQAPPPEAPGWMTPGCGTPLRFDAGGGAQGQGEGRGGIRSAVSVMGGDPEASNQITLPFSEDGSTCSDPHGYSAEQVKRIHEEGLEMLVARVTELAVFDGEQEQDLVGVEALGQTVSASTFNPPFSLGTCGWEWWPDGVEAGLNQPERAELMGTVELDVPWARFTLSPASTFGPYLELFQRPDPATLTDGQAAVRSEGLKFNGSDEALLSNFPYLRKAGRLKDRVNGRLRERYRGRGLVTAKDVLEAIKEVGGGEAGTVLDYQLRSDRGPLGTTVMRCSFPAVLTAIDEALEGLQESPWGIMRRHFGGTSEGGSVSVRFFDLDSLRVPGGGGAADLEVLFDAESRFILGADVIPKAIQDCEAFGGCR